MGRRRVARGAIEIDRKDVLAFSIPAIVAMVSKLRSLPPEVMISLTMNRGLVRT
jgi:hypothetical protein